MRETAQTGGRGDGRRLPSLSIRRRLALLAALVALPAAAFIAWSGLRFRRESIARAEVETERLADGIAAEQQALVAGAQQLMLAVAALPQVRNRDPSLPGLLAAFLRHDDQLLNVFVADPEGNVWAWAAGTGGATVADRRYFTQALATGGLSSGEFVVSRSRSEPTFHLGYPYRGADGRVAGVIAVALRLDVLRHLLARARLPAGTSYLLLDRHGVILARGIDQEAYTGTHYPAAPFARMQAGPEAETLIGRGLVGDVRIISWRKLRLPGEAEPYMYVRAGIPLGAVLDQAWPTILRNVAVFVLVLLLGLAAFRRYLWRDIVDRLALLERASRQLAAGDLEGRVSDLVRGGELGSLAAGFDDMAAQLAARTRALQESERNYREIFDATKEAIFVHDAATGRILEVNRMVERLYGYAREELHGASVADVSAGTPPHSPAEAAVWVRRALEEGPQTFEWLARRKDGSCFWVEVSLSATTIGGAGRVLATVRDVSARRQAEAENRALQERLLQAQKLEAVGRLAGGVAHDINNMLSVVLGEAELLREALPPDSAERAGVDDIQRAASRSRDITRQLLAFSRKQVVAPRAVDLNALVEATRPTLARLIGEDVHLEFAPEAGLWTVRVDPAQVDQVLVNLAVNARDAMPHGGALRLETRNVVVDEAEARRDPGRKPGRYAQLRVTDTGTGMDAETLAHAFEPFFTRKDTGKGTGLGLATVYGIATQNAGFVDAESAPGRGSTFSVSFPAVGGPAESAAEERPVAARGKGAILLVEDDPLVRSTVSRMLESLGYALTVAASPEEALRLCARGDLAIDLLVTDVVMPGMKGTELRRRVEELRPGLRAILMSGYAAEVLAVGDEANGGADFLQKPFTRAALAEKVQRALAGRTG